MFKFVIASGVDWPNIVNSFGPNGNHGDRRNGQRQRQKRRQKISKFVRARRRHVFFEQEFDAIGQRLQQAVRTHAIRSPSRLNMRHDFALEPGQIGERRQQHEKQDDDLFGSATTRIGCCAANSFTGAPPLPLLLRLLPAGNAPWCNSGSNCRW